MSSLKMCLVRGEDGLLWSCLGREEVGEANACNGGRVWGREACRKPLGEVCVDEWTLDEQGRELWESLGW